MGRAQVDPRRRVPRTDVVLADPRLQAAAERIGKVAVKAAVGAAQELARAGELSPDAVADAAVAALPPTAAGQKPVLNATGVVLHTNLGRASLSAAAREAIQAAAGHTDVELDLHTGRRARRGRTALAALRDAVPEAGDVHVVNNGAAALVLAATVLAQGREIVVSRGEMVEIGDGFRLPDLLQSTGARLREVGTTNRTTVEDYENAINPGTGFLLKVHPSNFVITGFTGTASIKQLAPLRNGGTALAGGETVRPSLGTAPSGGGTALRHGHAVVPLVVDIGSGLLRPDPLLPDEPDAATTLRDGADLVIASGDKLLGGPQAGLLLGDAALIDRLRRHPLARALRVDKLTLAALHATLTGPPTPTWQALRHDLDHLRRRTERVREKLSVEVTLVESVAVVGGGGAPEVRLPSWSLSLPEAYAESLRTGTPAVVGRVERGRLLLDLRCVPPEADDELAAAIEVATKATAATEPTAATAAIGASGAAAVTEPTGASAATEAPEATAATETTACT